MSGETSRPWSRARDLFLELAESPDPERSERLASLARADPALAKLIVELFEADARTGGLLDEGLEGMAPALLESEREAGGEAGLEGEPEGRRIGPYRVLKLLGHGGMGEVYLVERTDGEFEQRAALKLLRRSVDSDTERKRFLRERQLLARLEHPHIARLLDGGTDQDRPFFVLEYVEGQAISEFCRRRALSVEERLHLILACCDAVETAHRSLVVHRDLKPSNILVTESGEVKLLDFGIAKMLAERDEDALTRDEERVLTPAYAAPEQIRGEPVTTATDVYSLGVILYELLTGRLPAERGGTSFELASRVEDETIERPSRAVQRADDQTLERAGFSQAHGARIAGRLSGDLDSILLKALRREPDRRYASAQALGDDLRRHLDGRPVQARPDTVSYRAGKFLRRHRASAAAAALVSLALLGGLGVSLWQAKRARTSAREARNQTQRAQRVKEFLIGLFEMADPEQSGGPSVTAKDLIEQGEKRIASELSSEPEVQADLLEALARIERSLGRLDTARSLAEQSLAVRRRSLSSDDPALGGGFAALGSALMSQGKLDEAETTLHAGLAMLERKGGDPLAAARVRSDLSQALFWKGKVVEAAAMEQGVYETYRKELGSEAVPTAVHLRNLGVLLDELDRLDEAEKAYRSSQATLERLLTPDHPSLAQCYVNLAVFVDQRRNDATEAEALYTRSLAIRQKALGPSHPAVGQSLQLYALFLLNQGRLEESQARYQEALALFRTIDPKHFEIGKCNNGLALIASRRGDYASAQARLAEVVALFREVLGEKHPFVWQAQANLAEQIAAQGHLAEAESLLREAAERLEAISGKDSMETADALGRLGDTLRREGRAAEAVVLQRRALDAVSKVDAGHLDAALASARLGASLAELPDPASQKEAAERLSHAESLYRKLKPDHIQLAELLLARGKLELRLGDGPRARRDLEEAVALLNKRLGEGHPQARAARQVLSASIAASKSGR